MRSLKGCTGSLARLEAARSTIVPELAEEFGRMMRTNITAGNIPFRKAWQQAIVERIKIDEAAIRIIGNKTSLEQAIHAKIASGKAGVLSFVRQWYAGQNKTTNTYVIEIALQKL